MMSTADRLILAIDVGSSSIRCTAYQIIDSPRRDEHEQKPESLSSSAAAAAAEARSDAPSQHQPRVKAAPGCSVSEKLCCVFPNSGKINIYARGTEEAGGGGDSGGAAAGDMSADASPSSRTTIFDVIDQCVDETLAKLRSWYQTRPPDDVRSSFAIVGVAFSTFVMNLIGVDGDGNMVGEEATLTYACNDARVVEECGKLKRQHSCEGPLAGACHQKTGAPIHSAYALPQLRVLYSDEGCSRVDTVKRWTTLASFCISRWTHAANVPISFSEASWTGLVNFFTCEWDEDMLSHLPEKCRLALPSLCDFGDDENSLNGIPEFIETAAAGRRRNPYFERWPELRGRTCRLFLGIGDGACANVGSKCTNDSRIAVTIGTSAAARTCVLYPAKGEPGCPDDVVNELSVHTGLFCYRIDKRRVLVGGALTDGGSVVEWARSLLNLQSDDDFQNILTNARERYDNEVNGGKECSSLVMAPFLSGERSTGFRAGATGAMIGITRQTKAEDLVRSCLEGVILRINAVLMLMIVTVSPGARSEFEDKLAKREEIDIIASGNGLVRNPLWMQMLADCSGMNVVIDSDASESTSRGAALLAASRMCGTDNVLTDEDVNSIERYQPNKLADKMWRKKGSIQSLLIDQNFGERDMGTKSTASQMVELGF